MMDYAFPDLRVRPGRRGVSDPLSMPRYMTADDEITGLLTAMGDGDALARDRLFALVYGELRARARQQLARMRPGETLDTTALVHEAYLKLASRAQANYTDRAHFFAVASRAMRQILVDYARRASAQKRGGGASAVSLDDDDPGCGVPTHADALLALDAALARLAVLDERLARVVELRFFGGLSVEETAEALQSSPRTVKRDWRKARILLFEAVSADMDA
jgi:RNA polymerase sigma factor (TIGR02999 family)